MTRAIVSGLVADGYSSEKITVFDRNAEKRNFLQNTYKVKTPEMLNCAVLDADVVVLSIKPQSAQEACFLIKPFIQGKNPLILSVMAGLTLGTLEMWLGDKLSIVRAMPNTPSLVKAGATGLVANNRVINTQKNCIQMLMSSVGVIIWLEQEAHIDIITALSGSGPAYFFYFIEAMQNAAVQLGLTESAAKQLALQTAYGSALLALQSNESVVTLRNQVTSKGGTTAAALSVFKDLGLSEMVKSAMSAAMIRAQELSKQYGDKNNP